VLRRNLTEGRINICRLADRSGSIKTDRADVFKLTEELYTELYRKEAEPETIGQIPRVQNVGSEDIPEASLLEMKNIRSIGDDDIAMESIKERGKVLKYSLIYVFIKVQHLSSGTMRLLASCTKKATLQI